MAVASFQTLNKTQWGFALCFTVVTSFVFALGFVPTSQQLGLLLWESLGLASALKGWGRSLGFPLLAGFFYLSFLGKAKLAQNRLPVRSLLEISLLPLGIALGFAFWQPTPPLEYRDPVFWWYLLFVPLGEEWLFRGWFYNVVERLWPNAIGSLTNALPLSVWLSSIAFSLWHAQNLLVSPGWFSVFQIFYTFLTGVWLGYLRWQTGSLWLAILFHCLINGFALFI